MKKSTKVNQLKANAVKTTTSKKPKEETVTENSEITEDYEEEVEDYSKEFFNSDSYYSFISKNNLPGIDPRNYKNSDYNKIDIITPEDKRITSDIMTLAEYTRVISERAQQIEHGATIFINIKSETNPIKIAEQEILEKKCPLNIHRYITRNILEVWQVNEMCIPFK